METKVIKDESIRLRILANSNTIEDQRIKMEVAKSVQKELYELLKDTKDVKEARTRILDNLDTIKKEVETTLQNNDTSLNYRVNYGKNYFPSKNYKGINYNAGEYESLLVSLNQGKGDNWWCILFPPLCLLEAEESNDVEYKLLVKEIIEKYS
ncbi:stage II sporulation protein R [Firmicutes bacterium CAG:884]|nr:stage II sporulation protein R [Firmicutes bacterium CAG:884]